MASFDWQKLYLAALVLALWYLHCLITTVLMYTCSPVGHQHPGYVHLMFGGVPLLICFYGRRLHEIRTKRRAVAKAEREWKKKEQARYLGRQAPARRGCASLLCCCCPPRSLRHRQHRSLNSAEEGNLQEMMDFASQTEEEMPKITSAKSVADFLSQSRFGRTLSTRTESTVYEI